MTRALRLDPVDGWHHVMSRGVDRSTIFFSIDDRLDFGRILGQTVERFGIEVHAYCLMTNHFHLMVRCPRGNLSSAMHHLLSVFARRTNDRASRVGHLFGDRFCSRLIVDSRYLVNVLRYIHLNPLDIDGIDSAEEYRWSSHRTYLGLRSQPTWLITSTALNWFQSNASYAAFVNQPPSPITRRLVMDQPTALTDTIDMLLAERSATPHRHLPAQRRATTLSLAETLDSSTRHDLLEHLGLTSSGAIRVAKSRARSTMRAEPVLHEIVSMAHGLLDRGTHVTSDEAA